MIPIALCIVTLWAAYHCLRWAVHKRHRFYAVMRRPKQRRIEKRWNAMGFVAVRPGQYMARGDFTQKQLRAIEGGSKRIGLFRHNR